MSETASSRLKSAVRVILAAFMCFVLFVTACYLFSGESESARGLVISAPDDWFDGIRVCLAGLLASAVGTLAYRRPYSRPMAVAIAVGLVFLNLGPVSVWEQVRGLAQIPSLPPRGVTSQLRQFNMEEWTQFVDVSLFRRARLYWVYYLGYMFWTVVVLYSGYLGQYLAGLALFKGESRKESAVYLAENAGVGLLASVMAGVIAIILAAALSWAALPEATRAAEAAFTPSPSGPVVVAGGLSSAGPSAVQAASRPPALEKRAHDTMTALLRGGGLPQPRPLDRFRVTLFVVALSFFVTAYVAALSARPRTSTWVACGAVVGVMLLPGLAARFAVDPQELPPFFAALEMSPFALAGTAVAAGLIGDWVARLLITRDNAAHRHVYRPL